MKTADNRYNYVYYSSHYSKITYKSSILLLSDKFIITQEFIFHQKAEIEHIYFEFYCLFKLSIVNVRINSKLNSKKAQEKFA